MPSVSIGGTAASRVADCWWHRVEDQPLRDVIAQLGDGQGAEGYALITVLAPSCAAAYSASRPRRSTSTSPPRALPFASPSVSATKHQHPCLLVPPSRSPSIAHPQASADPITCAACARWTLGLPRPVGPAPRQPDTLEVDPRRSRQRWASRRFIRSWQPPEQGRLFQGERLNGSFASRCAAIMRRNRLIRPRRASSPPSGWARAQRTEESLGALGSALAEHTDAEIRRALAKTLSVPES